MTASVWIVQITHQHGTDLRVAATKAAAMVKLAEYCRENWQDAKHSDEPPTDTDAVIDTYFNDPPEQYGEPEEYEITEFPLGDSATATSGSLTGAIAVPSIGECLYGEHDETEGTLTEARGFLIVDGNGDHLCIVPGADDTYSENSPGAATARRIATVLGRDAGLLAFVQRIAALQLYGSELSDGDVDDPGEDAMSALNDAIEEARTLTNTVTAYVMVTGSQDAIFVGPFPNIAAATAYTDRKRASDPQFNFHPMTESEMRANIAEHGDIARESPDTALEGE